MRCAVAFQANPVLLDRPDRSGQQADRSALPVCSRLDAAGAWVARKLSPLPNLRGERP
jgi:hypothetical protein